MTLEINNHWLTPVNIAHSLNSDERPKGKVVSLLVIHNISLPPGEFGKGYVQQFFLNCLPVNDHPFFNEIAEMKVSSHLFIERSGAVTQFVPFNRRAWHAGVSSWKGQFGCNDFSIGIELEGTDTIPYTSDQYTSLAKITRLLMKAYPKITPENITGHEHIASGRKTDPGPAFDWKRYCDLIR